LRINYR